MIASKEDLVDWSEHSLRAPLGAATEPATSASSWDIDPTAVPCDWLRNWFGRTRRPGGPTGTWGNRTVMAVMVLQDDSGIFATATPQN